MHDPLKKADKFWKRKNTNVAGFNDFEQNISLLRKEIFAAQSKANTFDKIIGLLAKYNIFSCDMGAWCHMVSQGCNSF